MTPTETVKSAIGIIDACIRDLDVVAAVSALEEANLKIASFRWILTAGLPLDRRAIEAALGLVLIKRAEAERAFNAAMSKRLAKMKAQIGAKS